MISVCKVPVWLKLFPPDKPGFKRGLNTSFKICNDFFSILFCVPFYEWTFLSVKIDLNYSKCQD